MADSFHLALGELSRFVYCLEHKIKASSTLHVLENWEGIYAPQSFKFCSHCRGIFLKRMRLLAALEEVNRAHLRAEFRKDCYHILNELVTTVLSTVAARSLISQGPSCFCSEIIFRGDDYSAFYLCGQLGDGLLGFGCVKGIKVEAAEAKFHSFVPEQWNLEQSGSLWVPSNDVRFSVAGNLVFALAAIQLC